MNRLWPRLALMIGGVLFFMFFLQFASIMVDITTHGKPLQPQSSLSPQPPQPPQALQQEPPADPDFHSGPIQADKAEIARRLLGFAIFSLAVGTIGGLLISLAVTRPLDRVLAATRRIAGGEEHVPIPTRGPREFMDLAASFNAMAANLAKAEDQRRNLIADISHELRTPLTVLNGSLRAALDGVYTLDESEISRLCQQTNYLIHLVNDLRELSMAEAGKLALKRSAVDLEVLGEECLADLGPLAEDRGITLAGTWEALPILSLDSLRIRQILINLLSNAIRHSPDNGQVTLAGRLNQQTVELSVTDHGQGLEADQLAAVFDRFYRVDPSRSRESGGSGLGLSIARALAQSHGGDLTACSQGLGTGATFTLVLPRA